MRILNVIRSLDPASGGPIEAVKQFGGARVMREHTFEVASLDAPDNPWRNALPFAAHGLGRPRQRHYGYSETLVPWLRQNAPRFDAVLAHGLWQYGSLGVWRALRGRRPSYFIFPHGMLDPWFKRTYPIKHLKKWFYWPWAEYRVLGDARTVFFTCEEERMLARQSFWLYRAREKVVNLGTAEPPGNAAEQRELFWKQFPPLRDRRLVLFLGRIHEKKGCDLLLEAFAQIAARDPALHLVMAGPDQMGWQRRLEERSRQLGIAPRVTWPGMLSGDLKWGALHAAEVFVLPSHQENFGLAVIEALACGLPVLISNRVNIWREIEADAAGLVAEDTLAGTASLLERWLNLSPAQRRQQRESARGSFCARFEINRAGEALLAALQATGAGNP